MKNRELRVKNLRCEPILYIFKEEGVAGHTVARSGAVLPFDDVPETVYADTATPHVDERTHHGANHVTKEAVGRYHEMSAVLSIPYPSRLSDITECSLYVGIAFTESGKVLIFKQQGSSLVHFGEVKAV